MCSIVEHRFLPLPLRFRLRKEPVQDPQRERGCKKLQMNRPGRKETRPGSDAPRVQWPPGQSRSGRNQRLAMETSLTDSSPGDRPVWDGWQHCVWRWRRSSSPVAAALILAHIVPRVTASPAKGTRNGHHPLADCKYIE
jgi:hypothetical protein